MRPYSNYGNLTIAASLKVLQHEQGRKFFFDQPQWKCMGIEYLTVKIYSLLETWFKSFLIFSLANAWIRLKVILDLAFAMYSSFIKPWIYSWCCSVLLLNSFKSSMKFQKLINTVYIYSNSRKLYIYIS